ncbi:unnamed protein product [Adineta steineri]|uniref:Uncharacterized protein n=1 Tax=Adineta steineri TaxID=433720 RepID=A0A815NHH2_9BILA|nr:unnamed protein product [Adineta steineri]CAF1626164.1 unnamed protein product [Adineta steineri]
MTSEPTTIAVKEQIRQENGKLSSLKSLYFNRSHVNGPRIGNIQRWATPELIPLATRELSYNSIATIVGIIGRRPPQSYAIP